MLLFQDKIKGYTQEATFQKLFGQLLNRESFALEWVGLGKAEPEVWLG